MAPLPCQAKGCACAYCWCCTVHEQKQQADALLSALSSNFCLQHLGGLADGRNLDLAQVPDELQGNLFTAAVAAGMRVVPHIKPGTYRMVHR